MELERAAKLLIIIGLNFLFHNATRFVVSVKEDQVRLSTFYWLPKLHKKTLGSI